MMCLHIYEMSILVCKFEVFASITVKITILWDMTRCSPVEVYDKYDISIFRREAPFILQYVKSNSKTL